MQLTPYQLGRIEQHLRFDIWLSNSALITELTDHYAETTKAKMATGISFDDALAMSTADFGGQRGLLAMEKAANVPVFRQCTTCLWQVIQSYRSSHRLLLVAGLFLTMCCIALVWPPDRLFYYAQTCLFIGMASVSVALFIQRSVLYVAGRTVTHPFPAFGFRLTFLFSIFTLMRVVTFILTLMPGLLSRPLTQAALATVCIFLWLATSEAIFIKKRFAVQ